MAPKRKPRRRIRRESHKEIKERLVRLLGGQCAVCGYKRCLAALEFHHRDPKTKKFGIGSETVVRVPWEKVVAEAMKCVLLCANCHREHHFLSH